MGDQKGEKEIEINEREGGEKKHQKLEKKDWLELKSERKKKLFETLPYTALEAQIPTPLISYFSFFLLILAPAGGSAPAGP